MSEFNLGHYTYLFLNALTLFFPVVLSFDKKVAFIGKWKFVFGGIVASAIPFLIWDHFFTVNQYWGFNPQYISGIYILQLPLEEWGFFLTVPFACVFIYECFHCYFPKNLFPAQANTLLIILGAALLFTGIFYFEKAYTSLTFISLGTYLMISSIFTKRRNDIFIISFITSLIPFYFVNGVLTVLPVVWYNNFENLGMRSTSIPVEDPFYAMLLLVITIDVFEFFRNKQKVHKPIYS